jgi:hypothetical protein
MKVKLFVASLAGLVVLAVGAVRASDPVGVYCLISKVVLAPNDTEPTTVQVWGAFSFAVRRQPGVTMAKPAGGFGDASIGDVYGPVQVGYLYFTCAKGSDSRCLNEWNDLKSVAGTGKVVGFGGRYTENGRIRISTQEIVKLDNPDIYPIHMGVVPIGSIPSVFGGQIANRTTYPDLIAALGSALAKK